MTSPFFQRSRATGEKGLSDNSPKIADLCLITDVTRARALNANSNNNDNDYYYFIYTELNLSIYLCYFSHVRRFICFSIKTDDAASFLKLSYVTSLCSGAHYVNLCYYLL
ncbi:hypothetical protein SAMN05216417_108107 [Nitrosospira multiformis]|uniref:Uncharacterized protein n=1 Tax=Nitrosospira multiformis TaxID=1231 RepID=A0A1I7HDD3_9PROT|nr:hypothetical protein SAMN05216417_108107 [Nitrosospira multiformis]